MGYYINTNLKGEILPKKKVDALVADGAIIIPTPNEFIPNLVCVVHNLMFDAAGYAYSKEEMERFLFYDGRARTWLIVANAADRSLYNKKP